MMPQFHETRMGHEHYAMLTRNLGNISRHLENISVSLASLVQLKEDEAEGKGIAESRVVDQLNDELEAVLGGVDIWKELTPEEADDFRNWATENYTPGDEINACWHPVVQEACIKMNAESGLEGRGNE